MEKALEGGHELSLSEAVDKVYRYFGYAEKGGVVLGISAQRFAKSVRAENPLWGLVFGMEADVIAVDETTLPLRSKTPTANLPQDQNDWILFYPDDSHIPTFGIDLTDTSPRWMDPIEFEPVVEALSSDLFTSTEVKDGHAARMLKSLGIGLQPISSLPEIFARVFEESRFLFVEASLPQHAR